MKSIFLTTIVSLAFVGCSSDETTSAKINVDGSARSPETVVQEFYDAVNAKNEEAALNLMTVKARTSLAADGEAGGGFSLENADYESVDVKASKVDGDQAEVPVVGVQNGDTQNLTMMLRKEVGEWRIYGVAADMGGGQKFTMDFEKVNDMLETMVETIGDGLQNSFDEAFKNAQTLEHQLRHIQFETLHGVETAEYESLWMNETDFRDQTVLDALITLGDGLGLTVDVEQLDVQLDRKVNMDLRGMSKLAVIELLCTEAGVHATYPDVDTQFGAWGGALVYSFAEGLAGLFDEEKSAIRFEGASEIKDTILEELSRREGTGEPLPYTLVVNPGPAPYPSIIAGPFRIGVREVEEKVPYGTGVLGLVFQGFGIHESVMALTSKVGEFVVIDRVKSAGGESLIEPNMRYFSSPAVGGNALTDYLNITLRNLLRAVETIHVTDGSLMIYVPQQVDVLEFEKLQAGMETKFGELTILIKNVGSDMNIEIEGPEPLIEKLLVAYELLDENGHVIPVVYDSAYPWGKKLQIQITSEGEPSSMILKLVTRREEIEYPFELNQIPLVHFSEMPESIEALDFGSHETPLTVSYTKMIEADGNFNRVMVTIENHSNKDVIYAHVQFEYKDENGDIMKEASTTLSGQFNVEGQSPLVKAAETTEQETTAFFMPENTHAIGIRINNLDFIDGSEWQPSEQ